MYDLRSSRLRRPWLRSCQCLKENKANAKRLGSALRTEKIPHQRGAILAEDAPYQFGPGMKRPGCGLCPDAPAIAVLFIFGAKDDAADLAPVQCAGAHQAGFDGYV